LQVKREIVARGRVYYPLHCYSLSHLVPSLLSITELRRYHMMRFLLYFFLGGTVTALVAYLANRGEGTLSAFVAAFPVLTALTFLLVSAEGRPADVAEYARGLILFTPAWICYVVVVLLGFQRLGTLRSIVLGMAVYVLASAVLRLIFLRPGPGWP